jgi:hypothetical protein
MELMLWLMTRSPVVLLLRCSDDDFATLPSDDVVDDDDGDVVVKFGFVMLSSWMLRIGFAASQG